MADLVHGRYEGLVGEGLSGDPWHPRIQNTVPTDLQTALLVRAQREDDLPRTFKCLYTPTEINSNSTEALVTLTPTNDFATGTAANNFTVPAGKTFRPQMLIMGGRVATANAPPNWGVARLRANVSGAVAVSSPLIGSVHIRLRNTNAVAIGHVDSFRFPEGTVDLPAGASYGISFDTATGTVARTVWSICLIGYEF